MYAGRKHRLLARHKLRVIPYLGTCTLRLQMRRSQKCKVCTKGSSARQRHRGDLAGNTSAKYEPPWGHLHDYINFDFLPDGKEIFSAFRSAKTHSKNQVLPHRLGACLASRLDHHPAFGIPSAFTRGPERTNSTAAALTSAARPRWQRTELHQIGSNARRRSETGTCDVCCPRPNWRQGGVAICWHPQCLPS